MARFILSNCKNVVDRFESHCEKMGFSRKTSVDMSEKISASFIEKLCLNNNNYLSNGTEWVSTIGTCFYKGKLGADGLKLLLSDAPERTIEEIRADMKGNFVVLLGNKSRICIFTDEFGIYNTFYHESESGDWVIGTSLYEMAKVSSPSPTPNEFNMLEQVYCYQIFGDETVFDGFKKLSGREYIEVNVEDNNYTVKEWPDYKPFTVDHRSPDVLASESAEIFKSLATMVHGNFHDDEIAMCMTGGLDSRMVLSSFLVSGIKPVLLYGIGNSMLTNTHQEDLDVNQMYASKYGLTTKTIDWRSPEKIDEGWDYYIDKYGMSASVYSSSPMVMQSFESVTEKIVFLGTYGEIFRNETIAEHQAGEELSMDNILDRFYIQGDLPAVFGDEKKYHEFRNYLKKKFERFLSPYLNEKGKLPIDHFCFFANEQQSRAHVSVINYLNQQRYCFAILADPSLVKRTFAPVEVRDDAKIIINILNHLFPEILDIPIYSRYAWRVYSRESNRVVLLSDSTFEKWKNLLLTTKAGQHLKSLIRPILHKINVHKNPRNTLTHHQIAHYLQGIIDKEKIFDHHINVVRSEYISKESRYAILLRTFKKAKSDA